MIEQNNLNNQELQEQSQPVIKDEVVAAVLPPKNMTSPERLELVRDLINFDEWMLNKKMLSERTRELRIGGVRKFLTETNSITDLNEYNNFVVKYCFKKRCISYFHALRDYVEYHFCKKEDKELRDQILEALKFVKPSFPPPKKQVVVLSDDDVLRILKNFRLVKHKLIARMQYELGIRIGDAFSLKRGDIRYEPYHDKVLMALFITGKGNRRYKMWVFNPDLQFAIEQYIGAYYNDDEYYFFRRNPQVPIGRDIHNRYRLYLDDLKQACFKSGINHKDWASHDFRRNVARLVWNKWHDLLAVKEMLHHAEISTTMRYLTHMGLKVQEMQEALDVDRLERKAVRAGVVVKNEVLSAGDVRNG